MTRNNTIVLIAILVIFIFALWAVLPLDGDRFGRKGLRLGLDLVGGVHLVYEADFSQNATEETDRSNTINMAVMTIQKRIDKYGVTEPVIQKMGDDRILIQLPGFTDIEAAKRLVEQTGFLEFREVELNASGQPVYLQDYLQQDQLKFIDTKETSDRIFVSTVMDSKGEDAFKTVAILKQDENGLMFTDSSGNVTANATLEEYGSSLSWIPARGTDGTQLTGTLLTEASPTFEQSGVTQEPVVSIVWDSKGSIIFDQIAARLYPNPNSAGFDPDRALGIFLDGSLISRPEVNAQKFDGRAIIHGNFTTTQAIETATLIGEGSLPMPLKKPPLYQEKVSATLGANFIHMSWIAGVIGIVLVMLFMIAYYRLPGLVASLALVFYGALVLAIFKLWPITLSLAGLGGFVVSIGMAVDANVLIFERLKEELRTGRTLGAAVEAGFSRAWTAILDSNVTTIIACVILIWLASSVVASSQVMGFAITLLIGVVISMFTAVVVTRTLLRLVIHSSLSRKIELFTIYRGKK
jgi:preprotein translocase subunit SecD